MSIVNNIKKRITTLILIILLSLFFIPVIKTETISAANIRIAICGTNPSEYYQVDDDIWQLMEDLGATVTKVGPSVDVSKYDGLLIPGGIDIDPSMYGESDYACNDTDISFDRQQMAVIGKFVEAGKPILGICRGFQLLNIYFGGTLVQDVPGHYSSHSITSSAGSELYEICGSGFTVSSRHHQAIKTLGGGIIATQWAPDGLIEGAEHSTLPIIGVMWHPEWSSAKGTALVRHFLFSMCASEYEPRVVYRNGEWVYRNSKGIIDLTFTGLASNENGWWYVKNGKVDFSYTGIAHNSNGWWRVENGKVNFSYNGFAENENGWWFLESGKVRFNKNDIIQGTVNDKSGWWLVRDGKVSFNTTVAQNSNGWWYVRDGIVDFGYTGIGHNSNGWWRIENGKVNFRYNGFASNENGWWYLEDGRVRFNKTDIIQGTVNDESGWWHVSDGKVVFDTTVAHNSNGWWYVNDGKVDFSYTGIAENGNGIWRIENGKVNFSYKGFASDDNNWWYMEGGKAQIGRNDVISGTLNGENGWWHVSGGKVIFDTTVAHNSNGWWYVNDGKVDFSYTGIAENENGIWRIENGKVNFGFNGNIVIDGREYVISSGRVISINEIQSEDDAEGSLMAQEEQGSGE